MAIPSMRADLGISSSAIGFATGMFFWGYIVLQIPAGRLAGVWSAKRVIMALLVGWSTVSITTAFVQTEGQLIANRFALGVVEGGVLTCVIVLIRAWFTRAERARANTVFLLSLAVAPIIANPVSGLILSYSTWRWTFVLEALPGLLWGAVWWWAIEDDPRDAAWLPEHDRAQLLAALEAERQAMAPASGHWATTLWHPAVLLLAAYNFMALMAEWGVTFWLPSVLKDTGLAIGTVGVLAAIPFMLGCVVMVLVARSSDRRGERKWHMIGATTAAGLCLLTIPFIGNGAFAMICVLTLSIGCFLGRFGPFWTLPTEVLSPAVAGVGIGLINGAGNLGGTVGPYFFGALRAEFGNFKLALAAAGLSMIVGALVAVPIGAVRRRRVRVAST